MIIKMKQDRFALIKITIYDQCGFVCSEMVAEPESREYEACRFKLDNRNVLFRVSKITPKKVGQFVVLWKRIGSSPIQPYDALDNVDLVVINVFDGNNAGQFVFPKSVLIDKNIFSKNRSGGKLGFRVYPSWVGNLNANAEKTQCWQLKHFVEFSNFELIDFDKIKRLYADSLRNVE